MYYLSLLFLAFSFYACSFSASNSPVITTTSDTTAQAIRNSTTWEYTAPNQVYTKITIDSQHYQAATEDHYSYRKLTQNGSDKVYQSINHIQSYGKRTIQDQTPYCAYTWSFQHEQWKNQKTATTTTLRINTTLRDNDCTTDSLLYPALIQILLTDVQQQLLQQHPTDTLTNCLEKVVGLNQSVNLCYQLVKTTNNGISSYRSSGVTVGKNYAVLASNPLPLELVMEVTLIEWDAENTVFTQAITQEFKLPTTIANE